MAMLGLHHVQLAMPRGRERDAEAFYEGLLEIPRVRKPTPLDLRGGCWFESEGVRLHLGAEDGFSPARRAHPAILVDDLETLRIRLTRAGVEVVDDEALPGFARFYVADPFGNRLEFLSPVDA
jgi:catechol 2,3-dioxygenase-like lactoylglutathione lyase family enzyme